MEDTAKIGLRFKSGVLGSLHLDYNRQPPVHTFEIVGTRSTIKWDLRDGATCIYRPDEKAWGCTPLPDGWERNVMFMDLMRHFVAVVHGEAPPICPLEDGIRVQQLVEAVQTSQTSGQIVRF